MGGATPPGTNSGHSDAAIGLPGMLTPIPFLEGSESPATWGSQTKSGNIFTAVFKEGRMFGNCPSRQEGGFSWSASVVESMFY